MIQKRSLSMRKLLNNRSDVLLNDFQLVLLVITYDLLDYVLHCLDEIFKGHLVWIGFVSHHPDVY